MIEFLKIAAMLLLVLGVLFAPSWYRLYYRIRYGKPYVIEDSGR